MFPAISATGGLRCGGFIYGDANERWPDGTWIMTSICAALYDDFKEDAVIRTRNSTYRLGKRRQDGQVARTQEPDARQGLTANG